MNFKLLSGLFLAVFIIVVSCSKENDKASSDKAIVSFKIDGYSGVINESEKTVFVSLPLGTDVTMLTPVIEVSPKATISPNSGVAQDFSNELSYIVTAEDNTTADYLVTASADSCANSANVYSFSYNGTQYEIILENKSWSDAAACAVERGGYLAHINSEGENSAIFNKLNTIAELNIDNSTANDGGNATYVWTGGNDMLEEGKWIWDGNNDEDGAQFWQGDASGSSVDNKYTNWGNEPDNYGEQDALGLALTEWPLPSGGLGVAGQWNDISKSNALYFVVELDQ